MSSFSVSVHSVGASVFELLQSVVLEPEQGPPKLRLLAAAVLRELAPSPHNVVRDFAPPVEERNVQFLLPVLLAQGNGQDKLSFLTASHLFRSAHIHRYSAGFFKSAEL